MIGPQVSYIYGPLWQAVKFAAYRLLAYRLQEQKKLSCYANIQEQKWFIYSKAKGPVMRLNQ